MLIGQLRARRLSVRRALRHLPVILLATACSSETPAEGAGDSSSADPNSWSVEDSYSQTDLADPGVFVLDPAALVLAPGETAQLGAMYYDAGGSPAVQASLEFATFDKSIARVIADGSVTALTAGEAVVLASRAGQIVGSVQIRVTAAGSAGPISARFGAGVFVVPQGESREASVEVLDGRGNLLGNQVVTLESPQESAFAITGTSLQALRTGAALITASVDGTVLAGSMLAVATPDAQSASCAPGKVEVLGCSAATFPTFFARPSLAGPVEVFVTRFAWNDSCSLSGSLSVTRESPEVVRIQRPSILGGGAGILGSLAPGHSGLAAYYDGQICMEWTASVHPDLDGGWEASCENGDVGGLELQVSYPHRDTFSLQRQQSVLDGSGARTQAFLTRARGRSCFSNAKESFECDGAAEALYQMGLSLSECAGDRHSVKRPDGVSVGTSTLDGPDRFTVGTCSYTRGDPGCGGSSLSFSMDDQQVDLASTIEDAVAVYLPSEGDLYIGNKTAPRLQLILSGFSGVGAISLGFPDPTVVNDGTSYGEYCSCLGDPVNCCWESTSGSVVIETWEPPIREASGDTLGHVSGTFNFTGRDADIFASANDPANPVRPPVTLTDGRFSGAVRFSASEP